MKSIFTFIFLTSSLLFAGCTKQPVAKAPQSADKAEEKTVVKKTETKHPAYENVSLDDKIGQMIMIGIN
ncbi:MAG TPA: hypothetical protein VK796_03445, partial [Cytophaga sp.]|nr:hypothetical protein [Cytophaga sp.]